MAGAASVAVIPPAMRVTETGGKGMHEHPSRADLVFATDDE
jgi:hypothetical protein